MMLKAAALMLVLAGCPNTMASGESTNNTGCLSSSTFNVIYNVNGNDGETVPVDMVKYPFG
jgi:hypothetical protein